MKKIISVILLTVFILSAVPVSASAESSESNNWFVAFRPNKTMLSNFSNDTIDALISELQPGDDLNIRVWIMNQYSTAVDWYMWNEVIKSLESSAKSGGGYTYELSYTHPDGSTVDKIYSSDRVGGEDAPTGYEGLKEATANLKDYFFVDTLPAGTFGFVELKIKLDGETQGNVYQTKDADLKMRFAVEIPNKSVVKTGDDHNFTPLYIGMLAGGLGLLYFVLDGITDRKYFGKRKG